ncbi:endolytic transglycosylase MltG [Chitinophagaceae bacterium LB-8]|uniref:Endolytic murein transglycosylase n=1 Tax=Paraflavisolibacter caeni TaxID=2982496 RepID=A0A9X3B810_9BACT|nr:endolytic transglycosylase MltG [Paraflavisolibacter caeni]MCU7549096.1 endolytic transglycosylase MltG [Paraflavisolibacter caeni]
MKKVVLFLVVLLLLGAAVIAWVFFGPATAFDKSKETLYISSAAPIKKAVMDSLAKNEIIRYDFAFEWLANRMDYWKNIKPGKYDIKKGSSLLNILRMLRNGRQTPVNLVITKLRTKEDLARLVGKKFETDSVQMLNFLNNNDSLKHYDINPELAMTMVLPDTYTYFWNTGPGKIYKKLAEESEKFWTSERKEKAAALGLTPVQAHILASVVEEETNASTEKGNIASVYINRINTGMPLQADPTIKFALKDFGLKRIYEKHLAVISPYNTYRNTGLPPGPICTPTKATIDAVLNAPKTNYLYFVASRDFNGTHVFSATYEEHLKKAKEYQEALNQLEQERRTKL